jgi:sarcosine oxidase gamma subunit
MSELEFLGVDADAPARSPLARALARVSPSLGIRDVSLETGKIEVRGELGDVDAEVVRITPQRALLLCPAERTRDVLASLDAFAVDLTGALAGIELHGERLMRRLTDLDLEALPAVGSVAHVAATVTRDGDRFRIYFPQEYADYLAEVVVDAAEGLAR